MGTTVSRLIFTANSGRGEADGGLKKSLPSIFLQHTISNFVLMRKIFENYLLTTVNFTNKVAPYGFQTAIQRKKTEMIPSDYRHLCPKVALRKYDRAVAEFNLKYQRLVSSGYDSERAKIVFEGDLQEANCVLWQTVLPLYRNISARFAALENLRTFLNVANTTTVEDEEEPTPARSFTPPKLTASLISKFKGLSSHEVEEDGITVVDAEEGEYNEHGNYIGDQEEPPSPPTHLTPNVLATLRGKFK